jgi:hypothetical protein
MIYAGSPVVLIVALGALAFGVRVARDPEFRRTMLDRLRRW